MKPRTLIFSLILILSFLSCSILAFGIEKTDKEKILKSNKEWEEIYHNYRYEAQYLDALKSKVDEQLRIDVYLGLWCSDSKNNVPAFMKILDGLENPNLNVNYYTCEGKANKEVKYFVEDLKVERVPTFIFYRDGKEIGRIIENPKKSLIEDFLEIIF